MPLKVKEVLDYNFKNPQNTLTYIYENNLCSSELKFDIETYFDFKLKYKDNFLLMIELIMKNFCPSLKKFTIISIIIILLIITKVKIIILYIIYISIKNQSLINQTIDNKFFNQFLYNYVEDTKTFTYPFFVNQSL
jgi:hypothetical protein